MGALRSTPRSLPTPPMGQCSLNRSLASCPEMILANDNLVGGGGIVTGLLLATTGALATDGCLDANCFFLAIVFVLSTLVVGEAGTTDAYVCTRDGGSSGIELAARFGAGTIVGRLVSMTTLSGACCIEDIRMVGLLVSASAGSANDCGRNQFATNSNTSSDAPTQAMYRPIGIAISVTVTPDESRRWIP